MIRIDRTPLPAAVLAVLNAETGEAISFCQPAPQPDGSPTPVLGEFDVRAAIVEPWSNGQTEGQINKLKMVKRQMYGRAKIDRLEARLIGAV